MNVRALALLGALLAAGCSDAQGEGIAGRRAGGGGGSSNSGDPSASPDGGSTPPSPDGGGTIGDPQPVPGGKRVVAYFTAWAVYGRNYHVADIPAAKITHVNYAFANVNDAGECVLGDPYADIDKAYPGDTWDNGALRGSFNQLKVLKAKNPSLKTLISVGGWTWSGKFSDVAATAQSRQKFATSCVAFAKKYGFDGIDIDWEYPVSGGLPANKYRPEDKANYTLLLAELRKQLGPSGLLTIAAPAGPTIYANLEMPQIAQSLDWINIMTYDFHGGWESVTGHNAPLLPPRGDTTKFDVSSAVDAYLAAGIAAGKLVVGVPFYGRGWANVANAGVGQAANGAPTGTWEPGVFDYKDLANNYVGKNGFVRSWSDDAKVPTLHSAQSKVFITYDDAESMGYKAEYIKNKSLGGAMFWELSGDDGTLLDALNRKMK